MSTISGLVQGGLEAHLMRLTWTQGGGKTSGPAIMVQARDGKSFKGFWADAGSNRLASRLGPEEDQRQGRLVPALEREGRTSSPTISRARGACGSTASISTATAIICAPMRSLRSISFSMR